MIPKRNISEPLEVTFSARLKQIIELNERDQALTLVTVSNEPGWITRWTVRVCSVRDIVQIRNHFKALTLRYAWHDDFMTWNPDMHGGIKQIVVNADSQCLTLKYDDIRVIKRTNTTVRILR